MFSTRLRRTLLYTLAFTSVQTLIVSVASMAQMPSITRSHDAQLVRATLAVTRRMPQDDRRELAAYFRDALESHEKLGYIEVRDVDGAVLATTDAQLGRLLPKLSAAEYSRVRVDDLPVVDTRATNTLPSPAREIVVPFRGEGSEPRVVRALGRETALNLALARLVDRLMIVLPASFVAAAIVSWLLLRTTLSPLRDVAAKMRDLGPEALARGGVVFGVDASADSDEEVARLEESLAGALERIEEGYRAQSEFVANVAHEVKTPIAVLLAEAQSLAGASVTETELREFRRSTVEELRRLGKLVESFLVVARAARGGALTRHETVFLPEVVVDAVQHTRSLARVYGATVRPLLPTPDECEALEIQGDPELLGSMVENLIRNAIKFSPRGENIDVSLTVVPEGASIGVRDRGPGVPPELAESLFDRYVRVKSAGRGRQGFGLGLSIAANVARLHDGSISVENHRDGGALFSVTLPLGRDSASADEAPERS